MIIEAIHEGKEVITRHGGAVDTAGVDFVARTAPRRTPSWCEARWALTRGEGASLVGPPTAAQQRGG